MEYFRLTITAVILVSIMIIVIQCVNQSLGCDQCVDGLFSTIGCQGAPAYGSAPHFLSGAPWLHDAVTGIEPDPEKHTTFLNIEPLSGVAFQAHKRTQINFKMQKWEAKMQYYDDFFLLFDNSTCDVSYCELKD